MSTMQTKNNINKKSKLPKGHIFDKTIVDLLFYHLRKTVKKQIRSNK